MSVSSTPAASSPSSAPRGTGGNNGGAGKTKPSAPARKPAWRVRVRTWHGNLGVATAITLGLIALSCPFIAHGDFGIGKVLKKIHYGEFLPDQWRWLWIDSQGLALLLLIVSGWVIHRYSLQKAREQAAADASSPGGSVALLHGAPRSGQDPETVARACARILEAAGFRVFVCAAAAYPLTKLERERWWFVVGGAEDFEALRGRLPAPAKPMRHPRFALLNLDAQSPDAAGAGAEALAESLKALGVEPALPASPASGDPAQAAAGWAKHLLSVLRAAASPPSTKKPKVLSPDAPEPALT